VRGDAVSAFVTVQRGCDYRCTFCIVPMTRGPERSRKLEDVVREVTDLARGGTTRSRFLARRSTATTTARTTSPTCCARWPSRRRAAAAVHVALSHGPHRARGRGHGGDPRLRARAPPVQSGSSRVLKRMLRRYDRARYLDVVAALRGAIPALPSPPTSSWDSRARPKRTSRRHCRSSSRWGSTTRTPSSTRRARGRPRPGLRTPCPTRWRESVWSAWSRSYEHRAPPQRRPGRQNHEVLVEGRAKRGELLQGRTRTNKVALIAGPDAWIGGYRDVRFTGTTGSTFTAVPLGQVEGRKLAVVG